MGCEQTKNGILEFPKAQLASLSMTSVRNKESVKRA